MHLQKVRLSLNAISSKRMRTTIDLIIIFLVATIVFRNFIFSPEWPAGGDIMGFISREYLYGRNFRWLFVWRPNSFGYVEGVNLLDFFFMILHFVAGNAVTTAKVFAFSSFILAGFSMYAFGYYYSKKNLAALAGSLIYILNPVYLSQLTEAHLDIMFSYALIPLIFLFLDKALETGKARLAIVAGVLVSVMIVGFVPQTAVIYGSFLLLFVVIKFMPLHGFGVSSKNIKRYAKPTLIIGLVVLPLSAFMWVPFAFSVRAPYLSPIFSRGTLEDTYTYGYRTFADAFTLQAKESWGYTTLVDVTKDAGFPLLPVSTILLLVFAAAYLVALILEFNRYTLFFGLSALISILISMGPYSPFNYSFFWAWFNVPYFTSFRAISRWTLMTTFSTSFFVSASVSIVTGYVTRVVSRATKEHSDNEARMPQERDQISSIKLAKIAGSTRKLFYYLAILFLIGIFLSGFLSTWYLFSNGLQVYTPPSQYLEPYEYLQGIPGDYKIVTVGRSTGDWSSTSSVDMDFAGSVMPTPVGWTHDIGYESTFITDKPALQDGGLSGPSTDFVSYLRYYVARYNLTRDMLRVLGGYNYKYVVIPSYAIDEVRNFILSQHGGKLVYNSNGSVVLENSFYTPRLFAPTQVGLVFGGPETLFSLCGIDSFRLNETSLISAYQGSNGSDVLENYLEDCRLVVFSDADLPDLLFRPSTGTSMIYAGDYGVASLNTSEYWVKTPWWTYSGQAALGGRVLTTNGRNLQNMPFEVSSDGNYDVYLRVAFAPGRGKMLVSIDSLPIAEIRPNSDFWIGLRWMNLTSDLYLQAGHHVVTLSNDGSGYNDVDAIAIVKKSKLDSLREDVLGLLQPYDGSIVYMIEAEKAFSQTLPPRWFVEAIPGEGYALRMDDGLNVAPLGQVSASSFEGTLEPKYAIDDVPNSRWASLLGMPQWLQVTWPTIEEVKGIAITFENAYARDYKVQTWNGSAWIDQATIANNTMLQRANDFAQPVVTDRLRVLVTDAPAYNMVSIYELQAFSTSNMTSSKIFVPKEGIYNFTARLVSDIDTNGIFYLKVDDKLFSIPTMSSNTSEVYWNDVCSTFLDVGEHTIGIGATGKLILDKLAIYLPENGAQSLNELFKTNSTPSTVQFEENNPCSYTAHISSTQPFLLTFSEAYNPMWKAYVDGQEISPIATNFVANGYYINKTGSFEVMLYFVGQTYAEIGLAISGATAVFVAVVVFIKCGPYEKLKQRFRRMRVQLN
jgi:hypothetical protein